MYFSLLAIAEETLAEFLGKATGTAVDWVQLIGMKVISLVDCTSLVSDLFITFVQLCTLPPHLTLTFSLVRILLVLLLFPATAVG